MGRGEICFWCFRSRCLVIYIIFLFVSSVTQFVFMAEGRAVAGMDEGNFQKVMTMVRRQTIGSRPPRCEKRCLSCGHCEAVQIPVRLSQNHEKNNLSTPISSGISYFRGDDISNYKPMSWKCKCGNLIFNP